jgi:hypothetical protein
MPLRRDVDVRANHGRSAVKVELGVSCDSGVILKLLPSKFSIQIFVVTLFGHPEHVDLLKDAIIPVNGSEAAALINYSLADRKE